MSGNVTLPKRRYSDRPVGEVRPVHSNLTLLRRRLEDRIVAAGFERMMASIMAQIAFVQAFEERQRALGRE